jgi:type VI protein secretion system component VasK
MKILLKLFLFLAGLVTLLFICWVWLIWRGAQIEIECYHQTEKLHLEKPNELMDLNEEQKQYMLGMETLKPTRYYFEYKKCEYNQKIFYWF